MDNAKEVRIEISDAGATLANQLKSLDGNNFIDYQEIIGDMEALNLWSDKAQEQWLGQQT